MKIALGLLLLPAWIVFMVCVYPILWLGARSWHLVTGDEQPLNYVQDIGWARR